MDITQVVALTDYENRLQFVTTGLDCLVNIIEYDILKDKDEEGKMVKQHEVIANGQVINALALPGTVGQFAVSAYNEETDENYVQSFRRKT